MCQIEEYNNDEINLKQGSGDSKEDVIPDFVYDVSNMVVGCNFMNNISYHNSAKRKGILHLKVRKKNTGSRMGAQLFSCLDQLVNNILMADDCTLISENKK